MCRVPRFPDPNRRFLTGVSQPRSPERLGPLWAVVPLPCSGRLGARESRTACQQGNGCGSAIDRPTLPAEENRSGLRFGSTIFQSTTYVQSFTVVSMPASRLPFGHLEKSNPKVRMAIPYAQPSDLTTMRPLADKVPASLS